MFISGDFKSNDFANADSRGFTGTFFGCADSKGLASVDVRQSVGGVSHSLTGQEPVVETRQSVTVSESVASAKLLAGFASHVTSAVVVVNGKTSLCQRKCARLAMTPRDKWQTPGAVSTI